MKINYIDKLTKLVIGRLLNEQYYKTPGQEYTALFLDSQSRDILTDSLDDPPPGWTLHADHMTIKMGSAGVPARYLGKSDITIVGIATNDRVITVRVETDIPTKNDIPHITIATAPGARPAESNDFEINDFNPIKPITLSGIAKPKFKDDTSES